MKNITLDMLRQLRAFGKNPLLNLSPRFALWAKTEGGCWWWIKSGARKCLKRRIIVYGGSYTRLKKEEYAITEIPFTEYPITRNKIKQKKFPIKEYNDFKDLLIEEWLKFINQEEDIKKKLFR